MSDWITRTEACARLGVSESRIRQLIDDGILEGRDARDPDAPRRHGVAGRRPSQLVSHASVEREYARRRAGASLKLQEYTLQPKATR